MFRYLSTRPGNGEVKFSGDYGNVWDVRRAWRDNGQHGRRQSNKAGSVGLHIVEGASKYACNLAVMEYDF